MQKAEHSSLDGTIHEYLVVHVDNLLERLRTSFHKGLRPASAVMFWPRQPVQAESGVLISRVITMDLSEQEAEIFSVLRAGVKRTSAYAILLIAVSPEQIKCTLESPQGVDTWTLQRRKGSAYVKPPVHTSGGESLGVL